MGMDLGVEMERRDREDEEEKKRDLTLSRSSSSQLKELRENQERVDQAYKKQLLAINLKSKELIPVVNTI